MSLRSRLLIAIGVIAVVALVLADVVTYRYLGSFLYRQVDQQLDQVHVPFEAEANSGQPISTISCYAPPQQAASSGGPSPSSDTTNTSQFPANATEALAVEVRAEGGAVVARQFCSAYVSGVAYLPLIPKIIFGDTTAGDGSRVTYFDAASTVPGGPEFRVRASTLKNGDLLIVAQPLTQTASTLHQLLLIELGVTAGAVIVALAGGFWLVLLGLRPLRHMESTAESITAGNLTERIPGENGSTEVGRLAQMLNVMLTRIEAAFSARLASERRLRISEQRLRRFVADASHELRTPIAAISAYAELFGRGASDKKEDLERLMGGIRSETTRMEDLVADLLLLARLDEDRPLEYRSVDLVSLCAEAVQTASAVGPEWPIAFVASEPVEIMGDAVSIRQAVDNLLGNLRAHTPTGTTGIVSVARKEQVAIIQVTDDGPGMEAKEAEHVFERFYRSDPSRSRRHGGAGLGLSIVKAIVGNHGGTVSAEGRIGGGSTFTIQLPLIPPPERGLRPIVLDPTDSHLDQNGRN